MKFKLPKLILKSRIDDEINKEVSRAYDRKDKEYEKKIIVLKRQHDIEKNQIIHEYEEKINNNLEKHKDMLKSLQNELQNEIKSLEKENDSLYSWVNKMQDTYHEYLFKINDNKKRTENLASFVEKLLHTSAQQQSEIQKLKYSLELEIKEEDKQKEAMAKRMALDL